MTNDLCVGAIGIHADCGASHIDMAIVAGLTGKRGCIVRESILVQSLWGGKLQKR